MSVVTPKDLIDLNRRLILDDSDMFRASSIDEFLKYKRTIFREAYWIIDTLYRDIKTRRFYDNLTTDPNYWVIITEDLYNDNYQMYMSWSDENNIKHKLHYDILWYRGHKDYGFVFSNEEDVMAFKLRWL